MNLLFIGNNFLGFHYRVEISSGGGRFIPENKLKNPPLVPIGIQQLKHLELENEQNQTPMKTGQRLSLPAHAFHGAFQRVAEHARTIAMTIASGIEN